ncbi:MAG: hypothetical protein KF708_21130 [Pirellulales bacterium]|nr:hypothetical protein [Pirellulales bacterium]
MAKYELPEVPRDDSQDLPVDPAQLRLDERRPSRLGDFGLLALSCVVAGGAAFLLLANSRPTNGATHSAQLERQARLLEIDAAAEAAVADRTHE